MSKLKKSKKDELYKKCKQIAKLIFELNEGVTEITIAATFGKCLGERKVRGILWHRDDFDESSNLVKNEKTEKSRN